MSQEQKDKKKQIDKDLSHPLSNLVTDSVLKGAASLQAVTSSLQEFSIVSPIADLSALSTRIGDICGRDALAGSHIFASPLRCEELWGGIAMVKDTLSDGVIGRGLLHVSVTSETTKASELFANCAPWTIYTDKIKDITSSGILSPSFTALGALEQQTSLLAKDVGISKITSVASQLSTITGLFSEQAASLKELIAPTTMLDDLQSLALNTHKSFADAGGISEWGLGVLDSASYLVDRQVDWASQFCKSVYSTEPATHLEDLSIVAPKVNVISWLPFELEGEKKKNNDITAEEAFEKSSVYKLSEKGKRLINKIVDINNLCVRTGRIPIFKYTGGTMNAAATMGGTLCCTKDTFGEILDGFYKIFYENIEHIKGYVGDKVVRYEDVFQCVFRVKKMRNDYRHDLDHGSESEIRKKELEIGESYSHYVGKPVITSSSDYQKAQNTLYDEFDELASYILAVVSSSSV